MRCKNFNSIFVHFKQATNKLIIYNNLRVTFSSKDEAYIFLAFLYIINYITIYIRIIDKEPEEPETDNEEEKEAEEEDEDEKEQESDNEEDSKEEESEADEEKEESDDEEEDEDDEESDEDNENENDNEESEEDEKEEDDDDEEDEEEEEDDDSDDEGQEDNYSDNEFSEPVSADTPDEIAGADISEDTSSTGDSNVTSEEFDDFLGDVADVLNGNKTIDQLGTDKLKDIAKDKIASAASSTTSGNIIADLAIKAVELVGGSLVMYGMADEYKGMEMPDIDNGPSAEISSEEYIGKLNWIDETWANTEQAKDWAEDGMSILMNDYLGVSDAEFGSFMLDLDAAIDLGGFEDFMEEAGEFLIDANDNWRDGMYNIVDGADEAIDDIADGLSYAAQDIEEQGFLESVWEHWKIGIGF